MGLCLTWAFERNTNSTSAVVSFKKLAKMDEDGELAPSLKAKLLTWVDGASNAFAFWTGGILASASPQGEQM